MIKKIKNNNKNSFYEKVLKLKTLFCENYLKNSNELFLGYKEQTKFRKYLKLSMKDHLFDWEKEVEFLGLRVRFKRVESCFEVDFNPYY